MAVSVAEDPYTLIRSLAHPSLRQNYDAKQQEIRTRIMRERKMVHGYRSLKAATPNPDVQRDCDKKVKQSERMIEFFENSLAELDNRASSPGQDSALANKSLPAIPGSAGPSSGGQSSRWSKDSVDQGTPSSPPASGTTRKHNYSNLGEPLVLSESVLS